ncbi:sucrose-6-phosphate hydrolase [Clostridium beijerinckii]|uniref:glycoside hydrolase family 32 protein n=1 Tax=Clostridium beijerinckii TaxID=1520 RepID=UPI00156F95F6|nr:sucrose-6-phosphate hydrolase [Clostridium beijerinckii]NRT32110.1 beta-fructofuranosidase [Clostridium beijerinckii]NRT48462.1 beta-fructofuranosidase [Clostridium beijerinckii]NRZ23240.1 beta-fructofuranosidase [Clostridium beijerinckii]UYZ34934.1 sucrose-6-phosphate hydrolase [Clostridium beijerinckii]
MPNPKSYQEINQNLNNYYSNKETSIWRNNFHIEMPFGLINDPNGLSYYDNKFYIFYQWNPFGCEHKTKHWGLVTTTNFANFTKPQISLKPQDWFDRNGCYSGCGLVKDNELKLYYTGNVKGPNGERESYQCLATCNKDGVIEKHGVIIDKQPNGYTAHFRDPYVFIEDNTYYMILGVQSEDLKGRALIYESTDSVKWGLLGELKTDMKDFGYMWECPNIIRISKDKHAFIFSPQGLEKEELKNQNLYQSGYVIGELDIKSVELKNHSRFKELDMGFDFYAPQIFNHNGKNIMIGWIGMPDRDSEYPTYEHGWMYSLTMPRVLEYKNNVLYQKPIDEIRNLREAQLIDIKGLTLNNYNLALESRSVEIMISIEVENVEFTEVKFKFNDEYISITYDNKRQLCTVDRSNMNIGGKGIRKFKLNSLKELKMNVFIDNSVMEIYYQDGLEVTTLTYYPKSEGLELEIRNDRKVTINELNMWNLRSVKYE